MHGGMASGVCIARGGRLARQPASQHVQKESQLQHLGGYLGHVVEGAKCHKAIQQRW